MAFCRGKISVFELKVWNIWPKIKKRKRIMTPPSIDMNGKVAIVTGAGSGIGRASAKLFAKAGASVVACDLSQTVEQTVRQINDEGGIATALTRYTAGLIFSLPMRALRAAFLRGISMLRQRFGPRFFGSI
jgi:NAD(P)-dependent dehydrogenase (short-subunit alcohol dehydrogenase family)